MPRALRAFAVFCGHSLRFAARRYSVSRHNRRYNFQRKVFSYMCGFVGFTGNIVNRDKILRNMANRIIHRGPDMEGFHMSGNEPSDSVNLGFRRLSMIDLSDGAQPMYNEDGSVVVVFNGEIYNFMDLRRELAESGDTFSRPAAIPRSSFTAGRSTARALPHVFAECSRLSYGICVPVRCTERATISESNRSIIRFSPTGTCFSAPK